MNRDLAVALATGLAIILAMIAGGLFSYQLTLLGIAFAFATIIAILSGLYLQFWQTIFDDQPKHSVLLIGTLLSAIFIIVAVVQTPQSPDWRTFPNTALV
jgi:hypothetical protein